MAIIGINPPCDSLEPTIFSMYYWKIEWNEMEHFDTVPINIFCQLPKDRYIVLYFKFQFDVIPRINSYVYPDVL